MPDKSETYLKLDKEWRATCRVLLGNEVGELDSYADWLSSHMRKNRWAKSSVSGKETAFGEMPYPEDARAISFEEINFTQKYPQLSINQVKDIDSLIAAVSERICYAGNVVLGNTNFSEKSTHVVDSSYVYRSDEVFASKYVAYTTHCIYADKCFGSCGFSGSFGICANTYLAHRTLEVSKVDCSSDIYFSHGLSGCLDCIFCFNLKNKRNCIGNLALEKSKYLQLKAKLVGEMRSELEAKKRLPRLEEMACCSKPDYSKVRAIAKRSSIVVQNDMAPMEKAYEKACVLVLGKKVGDLAAHSKWLSRDAATFIEGKSCASGAKLVVPGKYAWFRLFPKDRLIALEEADAAGEVLSLTEGEVSGMGFGTAPASISKIAFFCPVWQVGTNKNIIDCPTSMDSANCFRCEINIGAKNSSHTFWPRDSDTLIGSFACKASSYSLKCYLSQNLQRCFEVDASRNCSDSYFCHNCENVEEGILCFNLKGARYAILNQPVSKEEYMRVKKMLLDYVNRELEAKGGLERSIFALVKKQGAGQQEKT